MLCTDAPEPSTQHLPVTAYINQVLHNAFALVILMSMLTYYERQLILVWIHKHDRCVSNS